MAFFASTQGIMHGVPSHLLVEPQPGRNSQHTDATFLRWRWIEGREGRREGERERGRDGETEESCGGGSRRIREDRHLSEGVNRRQQRHVSLSSIRRLVHKLPYPSQQSLPHPPRLLLSTSPPPPPPLRPLAYSQQAWFSPPTSASLGGREAPCDVANSLARRW